MSLHRSKKYGLPDPSNYLDRTRERLDEPVPHQAPQRERVTSASRPPRSRSPLRSTSPGSEVITVTATGSSSGSNQNGRRSAPRAKRKRRWQELISPDINFGVPQLMMILEPNVVWDHSLSLCHPKGSAAAAAAAARRTPPRCPPSHAHAHGGGANICSSGFFDGWDAAGKLAHGVYEGSYWQLLGDLSQLEAILRGMTGRAPQLQAEPELHLPERPPAVKWVQFAPVPLPTPEGPHLPVLALPEYVEPEEPAPPERPHVELLEVPDLGPGAQEIPIPEYKLPLHPVVDPPEEIELVLPAVPQAPPPPTPPVFSNPKHGDDWSGQYCHRVPLPDYVPPEIPPEPAEVHCEVPDPVLQEPQPDLQVETWVKLTWHAGPDEEVPEVAAPAPEVAPVASPELSSVISESSACLSEDAGATETTEAVEEQQPPEQEQPAAAEVEQPAPAREASQSMPAPADGLTELTSTELQQQWAQVQGEHVAAAAGQPMVWMDFKPPFAEPPPVLIPPKPDLGDEPKLVIEGLEDLPEMVPPQLQEVPKFEEPPLVVPEWAAPAEPQPIGFLRGCGPLLIMDVSGTMHPARRGMLPRVKNCVASLLAPGGEMATATDRFDVLAFAGVTWAWSHHTCTKRNRLASVLKGYYDQTGRQVGNAKPGGQLVKTRPASAVGDILRGTKEGACLAARAAARSGGLAGLAAEVGLQTTPTPCRPSSAGHKRRPVSAGSTLTGQTPGSHSDVVEHVSGLQPTTEDNLASAKAWVENWPDASGHTRLINALTLAHSYSWTPTNPANSSLSRPSSPPSSAAAAGRGADTWPPQADAAGPTEKPDCWYLFSDGLADGAATCLDWVQQQQAAGQPCPPIHCIGFFPSNDTRGGAGERFLRQLAALTGGSFQIYDADLAGLQNPGSQLARIFDGEQGVYVTLDLAKDTEEQRRERMWAEAALRALRVHNRRRGVMQPLDEMLGMVKQQHQQQRQLVTIQAHQRSLVQLKQAYQAALKAVTAANAALRHKASVEHESRVRQVTRRNEAKVKAAKAKHAAELAAWKHKCEERVAAWEEDVAAAQQAVAAAAEVEAAAEEANLAAAAAAVRRAKSAGSAGGAAATARPEVPLRPVSAPAHLAVAAAKAAARQAAAQSTSTQQPPPDSGDTPHAAAAAAEPQLVADGSSDTVGGITTHQTTIIPGAAGTSRPADGSHLVQGSPDSPVSPGGRDYSSWASSDGAEEEAAAAGQQEIEEEISLADGQGWSNGSSSARASDTEAAAAVGGAAGGTMPNNGTAPVAPVAGARGGGSRPRSAAPAASQVPRPSPLPPLPPMKEQPEGAPKTSRQRSNSGKATCAQKQQQQKTGAGQAAGQVQATVSVAAGALLAAVQLEQQPGKDTPYEAPKSLADIIGGITAANQQILQTLYEQWQQQLSDAAAANAAALQQYETAVGQAAAAEAANKLLKQQWQQLKEHLETAALESHRAALAKADAENQRLAAAHKAEIAARAAREQEYASDVAAYEASLKTAQARYEQAVVEARRQHAAAVAGEQARWRTRVEHAQQLWEVEKEATMFEHRQLVERIKEQNNQLREEARARAELHRAAHVENKRRQQVADEAYQRVVAAATKAHEEVKAAAYQAHQDLCARLQTEHTEAVAAAKAQHAAAVARVQARNIKALEEAKAAFAAAQKQQEESWEAECATVAIQHEEKVTAVREHNAAVWNQVQVARLANAELQRVAAFAAHMRRCAGKMSLGVNFQDGTPNLDRVVEMSALTGALQAAFPEYDAAWEYPWPGSPNLERTVDISGVALTLQQATAAKGTCQVATTRSAAAAAAQEDAEAAGGSSSTGGGDHTAAAAAAAEAVAEAQLALLSARGWQVRSPPPGPTYPGPVHWEEVVEQHYQSLHHQRGDEDGVTLSAGGAGDIPESATDTARTSYRQQQQQQRPATAGPAGPRAASINSTYGSSSSSSGSTNRPQTAAAGGGSRLGQQHLVISAYGSPSLGQQAPGSFLSVSGRGVRGLGPHLNTWQKKLLQKGVSVTKTRQQQQELQQRLQETPYRPRTAAGRLQHG